jgi:D-sedoheptulose 7-phosphate isomerase
MKEHILEEIKESLNLKRKVLNSEEIISQIENIAKDCIRSINNNGKIIFCGNGGSFADSQHLAAEFVSRLRFDRAPLPSVALGTNNSNLSAIGNDYGYDEVFRREIIALCNKNDLFIPISTSGNSPNIIKSILAAKKKNIRIYGLSGHDGGKMNDLCDVVKVPSKSTEKIQEIHIMIGHIICYLVEKELFN